MAGSAKPVEEQENQKPKAYSMTWAQRLKRVFAIDIEKCEKCGGPVRIIASIEDPDVIQKILSHLGLDPPGDPLIRSPP
jgi:23S rRNA U2552 (ribose-2'-O)-methylase RlmE/FtsJ